MSFVENKIFSKAFRDNRFPVDSFPYMNYGLSGDKEMPKTKLTISLAEQVLVKLMRVGDRCWRESDDRFRRWGISDNHYNVLRILNGAGEPISQIEIGRRMLSSRANVTKLIDLLEGRKFVKRLTCGDRRVKLIDLTEDGAKFIADTHGEIIGFAEEELKPLSKSEQKTLVEMLNKLSR